MNKAQERAADIAAQVVAAYVSNNAVAADDLPGLTARTYAALEVVFKRLSDVGLEKLCLQVHSEKANKRTILDELKAVYDHRRGATSDLRRSDYDLLQDQRRRLNGVAKALNEPLGKLGWSIQAVHGKLLQLDAVLNISSRITLAGPSASCSTGPPRRGSRSGSAPRCSSTISTACRSPSGSCMT